ncbi:MAG: DUF763 domain-containing protein [Nitrososphaerota archaeon]
MWRAKTGEVTLPLHLGRAPRWLVLRMRALAKPLVRLILEDFGPQQLLDRLANPYWLQALGCLLGYDWHSSGLTTVTTAVLRDTLNELGLGAWGVGGKGRASLLIPEQLKALTSREGLDPGLAARLSRVSRMVAKVDTALIQAGYPIYHQALFFTESEAWAIVQQGINASERRARRYHWLSRFVNEFTEEPHAAAVGALEQRPVLNLTSRLSRDNKVCQLELLRLCPQRILQALQLARGQGLLQEPSGLAYAQAPAGYELPRRLNWPLLRRLYEMGLSSYEALVEVEGVGPSLLRSLALASELIYGTPPSWQDPVKFSFAHGGKDGVPFPVRRRLMEEAAQFLRNAAEGCELDAANKRELLRRLSRLYSCPPGPEASNG